MPLRAGSFLGSAASLLKTEKRLLLAYFSRPPADSFSVPHMPSRNHDASRLTPTIFDAVRGKSLSERSLPRYSRLGRRGRLGRPNMRVLHKTPMPNSVDLHLTASPHLTSRGEVEACCIIEYLVETCVLLGVN